MIDQDSPIQFGNSMYTQPTITVTHDYKARSILILFHAVHVNNAESYDYAMLAPHLSATMPNFETLPQL